MLVCSYLIDYRSRRFIYLDLGPSAAWALKCCTPCHPCRAGTSHGENWERKANNLFALERLASSLSLFTLVCSYQIDYRTWRFVYVGLGPRRRTPCHPHRPALSEAYARFQKKSKKNSKKNSRFPVTSNLAAHTWCIKYRRKQKLITQFVCKSRNESFDPS